MRKILIGGSVPYEVVARSKWIEEWVAWDYMSQEELPRTLTNDESFYIQHAMYLKNNDSNDVSLICALQCMSITLQNSVKLAKQLACLFPTSIWYFSDKVKKDEDVIKSFIRGAHDTSGVSHVSRLINNYLKIENRITVAYDVCKKYPEYEERFGAALLRKLNGQNIVKYVETRNLFKKLNKEVPRKSETTRRTKI